MNLFGSNDDSVDIFFLSPSITGTTLTATYTTGSNIPSDKDWMPYRHFEYDPLWHKKYAAIKYQMETMWD